MQTSNTYQYGTYMIIHRTPLPEGRMLILGHRESAPQPWMTAFEGEDGSGQYQDTPERAWRNYAMRLADKLGLEVTGTGGVAVERAWVSEIQDQAQTLVDRRREFTEMLNEDDPGTEKKMAAEDGIEDAARVLVETLERVRLYKQSKPEPKATVGMNTADFINAVYDGDNFNREN